MPATVATPPTVSAQRLTGFLDWMLAAAMRAGKDLDSLILAQELMRPKLACRRRNSRISGLAELLLARPLVSAPMAARSLKVSQQAIQQMLRELAPVPRELSGRSRYRVWGIL